MTDVEGSIVLIPAEKIFVANPRLRNKRMFRDVVDSIRAVGLKRPITVAKRQRPDGTEYDLVCGQGRLEACASLGLKAIPAIVVAASDEDCLVMSLVENIARRPHRSIELLQDIEGMKSRGYSETQIAEKTGLTSDYVRGVVELQGRKEVRLLRAVESGSVPLSVAVAIARSGNEEIQQVLQEAYETKLLRGRKLIEVRRLVDRRRNTGKGAPLEASHSSSSVSVKTLLKAYRESADKKRLLVRKASAMQGRQAFVVEALRKLLGDEQFKVILRTEALDTLPEPLASKLAQPAGVS